MSCSIGQPYQTPYIPRDVHVKGRARPQLLPTSLGKTLHIHPMRAAFHYGIYINKLNILLEEVVNNTIKISNSSSYELQQTGIMAV